VILGIGICGYAAWGWLAAANRENRYGRVLADTGPSSPATAPAEAPFNPPGPAAGQVDASDPAEPPAGQDRAAPPDR